MHVPQVHLQIAQCNARSVRHGSLIRVICCVRCEVFMCFAAQLDAKTQRACRYQRLARAPVFQGPQKGRSSRLWRWQAEW